MKIEYIKNKKNGSRGFTLMEVIVTLVVAAILGAMLVAFTGKVVAGSAQLPFRMVKVYEMNQVMDNITADYLSMLVQTNSDVLTVLKDKIDNKKGNYGDYTSTTKWIRYNMSGTSPVEQDGASNGSDGVLKVVITPASGGGGLSHTALFTR
jgi:prepilin-type N-terminal cleavage/methylation domain-containing protein